MLYGGVRDSAAEGSADEGGKYPDSDGTYDPSAILPTIWVMQNIGLYKTIPGMVLVEIALGIPFTTMLFRGYMGAIPREIEEAARIDGCGRLRIFTSVIAPLLTPIASTVTILQSVTIFNDFTNPLYFLPGNDNVTIQLTLYNFMENSPVNTTCCSRILCW